MISNCEFDESDSSHISTTYRVRTALINQTGDWMCVYKNYKSNVISLAKYEVPITTTISTTVSSPKFQMKTKPVVEKQPTRNRVHTFEPIPQLNSTKESMKQTIGTQDSVAINIIQQLTRQELVLALVIMLGLSLLLNLSFLIRCVLLKSVVDNYHRGIPNGSCMLCCLCIDQYAQQKKYTRSLNLSNQVGSDFYRCQPMSPDNLAIYDDLSAVSNSSARMKLRSNHSSDMDEETRLTNFMSNGGCHINPIGVGPVSTSLPRRYTSPGHAAYFHPGLGNYVIVSGPIPAPQDQYTIGTTPPSYALQLVSPIPSAPGSIVGGHGTNMSAQSGNSDDLFDSDTSQTTNSVANQSMKMITNHPADLMDPKRFNDLSQIGRVPMNGFDQNHHTLISSQNGFNRPNGSVPLHPWPAEKMLPPNSSSVTSLPQYTASEKDVFIQGLHRINDPLLLNSISITATESTS